MMKGATEASRIRESVFDEERCETRDVWRKVR